MVRHYIAPGPISAAARSVSETAVSAGLVPAGDIPPSLGPGYACATSGTVDLAAIKTSADQHLRSAPLA